jgi:hypothetical protein
MTDYKEHELASLFPLMEGSAFDELVADIREHGQRAPATLCDGKLLDGRNRVRACGIIGIEPKYRSLNGEDPLAYVLSVNFHRRHLNESQRALIAAEAANLSKGRPKINAPRGAFKPPLLKPSQQKQGVSQSEAAVFAGVSRRSVQRAADVIRDAAPKEVKKIVSGEKTVTQVAREIKEKAKGEEVFTDKLGRTVPKELVSEWQRAETVGKKLRGLAREIKNTVEQGFAGAKQDKLKDLIYAEVGNSIITEAGALAYTLDAVIPYALCPSCQGRLSKNCTLCRKRGWISRFLWNSPAVNDDVKKLINRK